MTIQRSAARRGLVAGVVALTVFASSAVRMTANASSTGLGNPAQALAAVRTVVHAADALDRGPHDGGGHDGGGDRR